MALNYETYRRHMDGSEVEMLLRGHLWVEQCITRALGLALVRPQALKIDRMPFSQKVALTDALGLISANEAVALRIVNQLRNRLAHDLTSDFREEDVAALVNSLQDDLAKGYNAVRASDNHVNRPEHLQQLSAVFLTLVMTLEYKNIRAEWEAANAAGLAAVRMIQALSERTGTPFNIDDEMRKQGVPTPPDPRAVWSDWKGGNSPLD